MFQVAKMKKAYQSLAYLTLNCILLLIVVNLVLGGVFFVYDSWQGDKPKLDERVVSYREKFADYQAYKRTSQAEVTAYLDEQDAMGSIGFQYKPWVQFRNPSVRGRLLNTDESGFRVMPKPQVRAGKPMKAYVFGGSTTFGYGVPDDHTIPSYLQKILEKKLPDRAILVKNFGQAYYYSSQEQALLLSVLKNGDVPNWVVFCDAGNDIGQLALRHDEPMFTPALARLWDARRGATPAPRANMFSGLPMTRLAKGMARRLAPEQKAATNPVADAHQMIRSDSHLSKEEKDLIVDYVTLRYQTNMRIIRAVCEEFGVKCLFIWQPHPAYKYDRTLHRTFPYEQGVPDYFHRIHAAMESCKERNFLFLGAMTEKTTEKVYVDDVHYNEVLNELIADRMAEVLLRDAPPP